MTSTTITTNLASFLPTIDLAAISIREAFDLFQILKATSDLLNAALSGRSAPIEEYLDNWQGLLTDACLDMADVIHGMVPVNEHEKTMRNFLLVAMRLSVVGGRVELVGEGAPDQWGGSAE